LRILFIGDIVGRPGRYLLRDFLPAIKDEYNIDITIANGENAAHGNGLTKKIVDELYSYGIDILTSGNHIWDKKEVLDFIDQEERLIRPANYPDGVPGKGYTSYKLNDNVVFVVNIMGRVFMSPLDCPFKTIDKIIDECKDISNYIIIDFHGEATSEKIAFGYYVDGRVTAVLGTHTHVQTADYKILPGGTAYITDSGMTGPYDSVIGSDKSAIINKFITGMPSKFDVADGNAQLNAVIIETDNCGKAVSIATLNLTASNLEKNMEWIKMKNCDMHVHTIYSDGTLRPSEIIDIAISNKIYAIAITDHDTTEGVINALNLIPDKKLNIIPGIELSAILEGFDIHILGYWIDYKNVDLIKKLNDIKAVRIERIEKMVKNLYDIASIKIDIEEVMKEGNYYTLGRPHIARVLIRHGYANDISDAFDKYLNKDSPIYVEKYRLSPEEAVKMIVDAGGAPVLAHPGLIDNKSLIPEIIKAGIYGIEVYHPKHKTDDIYLAHVFAEKYNLIETGGSDFHSPEDDTIGKCTIPYYNMIKLKERIKHRGFTSSIL
jgi:conserved hypothetical protein TIGR00282